MRMTRDKEENILAQIEPNLAILNGLLAKQAGNFREFCGQRAIRLYGTSPICPVRFIAYRDDEPIEFKMIPAYDETSLEKVLEP